MVGLVFAAYRAPKAKPHRVFRIDVGPMHVTVHHGDRILESMQRLEPHATPRYFIDDREVTQAIFDAELDKG